MNGHKSNLGVSILRTRQRAHLLVLFLLLLVTPATAQVPGSNVFRLAHLASSAQGGQYTRAFTLPELEKLGYSEGKNFILDERFGSEDAMRGLAQELLLAKPHAIMAVGPDAVAAAVAATRTIPIITFGPDLVQLGVATSNARPGGNVTGVAILVEDLDRKRLDLLHEAFPRMKRIGAFVRPAPHRDSLEAGLQAVASASGFSLTILRVNDPADYRAAATKMKEDSIEALLNTANPILNRDAGLIAGLALDQDIITMCEWAANAREGCLIGYGPSQKALRLRMARIIARVFSGVPPGDIPIETPTSFEMAINLGTARRLGIEIAPSLLARADEVIE